MATNTNPYTYTGTAADNLIQLAVFSSQPVNGSIYNIDGAAGIDTLALNNTGYAKADTKFLSAKFTIAPVNASNVIVVSGASSGGTTMTFNLKSVETIVFSGGTTVALSYVPSHVNQAPTGAVTIGGTPTQNQTLTAVTSTLADADGLGTLNYRSHSKHFNAG
jgi:hypothetical protein